MKVWEALVQSHVRFNRVSDKVPEVGGALEGKFWRGAGEGLGGFGAEPGHVQQGSGEGSGEGLGGFVAEPGHVQQGSEKVWEALVQPQVRFNRVPSGESSGKGLGGFGAEPGQVQQGSGEGSGESGSTGFRKSFW